MVKDLNYFLTKIKKPKLYIVEFNKNSTIKAKNYLINYIVESEKCHFIIIITYDK